MTMKFFFFLRMADAESGTSVHVLDHNCFLELDNCKVDNFKTTRIFHFL